MTNLRNRFLGVAMVLTIVALGLVVGTHGAILTSFSDTFAGGVSGTVTRNALLKSAGDSQVASSSAIDNGTTFAVSEPFVGAGQISTTKDPADTTNTSASMLINPATSASSEYFLTIAEAGTSKFTVQKGGNVTTAGTLAVTGAGTFSSTLGVTGVTSANGGVQIGSGGATVLKALTATLSVDFTALAAGTCETFNITVTGAANGDPVSLGVPAAAWATTEYATIQGFVSATDTVTVKRCNLVNATTATSNPAAVTIRIAVWQF
jgi:hypothetical protein